MKTTVKRFTTAAVPLLKRTQTIGEETFTSTIKIATTTYQNIYNLFRENCNSIGESATIQMNKSYPQPAITIDRVVEKIVEVEKVVEIERIVEIEKIVEVEIATTTHPIFGTLLGEFGPKQVYSTPVKDLIQFDVWEKQRSFCAERANDLANAKRAYLDTVGFPGAITIVNNNNETTSASVVDGTLNLFLEPYNTAAIVTC